MKTIVSFICLMVCMSTTLFAQDTCKSYNVANPHGAAMTIYKVWIVDSTNFTVESLKSLPYDIPANGTVDFKACILPRDGVKRTTQVRYQNTHGTSSYTVTLTPPSTASVTKQKETPLFPAYPNPARSQVIIPVHFKPTNDLLLKAISISGKETRISYVFSEEEIIAEVGDLKNGSYTLIFQQGETIIGSSKIIVSR